MYSMQNAAGKHFPVLWHALCQDLVTLPHALLQGQGISYLQWRQPQGCLLQGPHRQDQCHLQRPSEPVRSTSAAALVGWAGPDWLGLRQLYGLVGCQLDCYWLSCMWSLCLNWPLGQS